MAMLRAPTRLQPQCLSRPQAAGTTLPKAQPPRACVESPSRIRNMLHYAVVFFVIVILAALFGFADIAAGAAGIAKILVIAVTVLAVGSLLLGVRSKS